MITIIGVYVICLEIKSNKFREKKTVLYSLCF